ncbi:MAG: GNAT family N-acetyltransferase [Pleurocapsa sp.]
MITIRKSTKEDAEKIWDIFQIVVARGDTYAFLPDISQAAALSYWMADDKHCYVAELEGNLVGTYIIKDNQPGLGSHIANASFMVSPQFQGRSVGKTMGKHALIKAKELGYAAMQFNLVISTNIPAINLWRKLGFQIIGTIPQAFDHLQKGMVDAHIMFREL